MDTLRHDRPGFAGHPLPTSPSLDRLAERGLVFTRSYSQAGWTLPSVATLLSGLHPGEHGATGVDPSMVAGLPTLATELAVAVTAGRRTVEIDAETAAELRALGHTLE